MPLPLFPVLTPDLFFFQNVIQYFSRITVSSVIDIKKQRFAHLRGTTSKLRLKIDDLPLTNSDGD